MTLVCQDAQAVLPACSPRKSWRCNHSWLLVWAKATWEQQLQKQLSIIYPSAYLSINPSILLSKPNLLSIFRVTSLSNWPKRVVWILTSPWHIYSVGPAIPTRAQHSSLPPKSSNQTIPNQICGSNPKARRPFPVQSGSSPSDPFWSPGGPQNWPHPTLRWGWSRWSLSSRPASPCTVPSFANKLTPLTPFCTPQALAPSSFSKFAGLL